MCFSFNPAAGASVDANLRAVSQYTGYSKEDIVMSDWTNREYQPCHFIAKDHEQKRIILAIRYLTLFCTLMSGLLEGLWRWVIWSLTSQGLQSKWKLEESRD